MIVTNYSKWKSINENEDEEFDFDSIDWDSLGLDDDDLYNLSDEDADVLDTVGIRNLDEYEIKGKFNKSITLLEYKEKVINAFDTMSDSARRAYSKGHNNIAAYLPTGIVLDTKTLIDSRIITQVQSGDILRLVRKPYTMTDDLIDEHTFMLREVKDGESLQNMPSSFLKDVATRYDNIIKMNNELKDMELDIKSDIAKYLYGDNKDIRAFIKSIVVCNEMDDVRLNRSIVKRKHPMTARHDMTQIMMDIWKSMTQN